MVIQVTGKNIEAGETYTTYVNQRVASVFEKFLGPELSGHARLEKERGRFHTHISVRLKTGLFVEAHGEGGDAYASADLATEHLEKRVRRYKRRLKDHHETAPVRDTVAGFQSMDGISPGGIAEDGAAGEVPPAPLVIAEPDFALPEAPVSQAALQLDLTDRAFVLFRNAANGAVNLVYRRGDGNIGWVDPK